MQKNLLPYSIALVLIIPIFGFNFLISVLGNILLLLLLIPILGLVIAFLGFNALRSQLNQCDNCGATLIGNNTICVNCGANLEQEKVSDPFSENRNIIEIDAEEIK